MKESQDRKGINPNSLKNLKPISNGEVRNPKGRPKGALGLSTTVRIMLEQKVEVFDKNGKSMGKQRYKDIIAKKLLGKATEGNLRAVELLFDRTEGAPTQKIEMNADLSHSLSSMSDKIQQTLSSGDEVDREG